MSAAAGPGPGAGPPSAPAPAAGVAAARRPVASVATDVALAHLDRPFDYLVPAGMDQAAQPGVRVRVRFAGRLVNGFLLERHDGSEHTGRLSWLERVVSPHPVLSPEVATLCRAVADRYAGTFADVARLAVPPRHARTEAEPTGPVPAPPAPPDRAGLARYRGGDELVAGLLAGASPRLVWTLLPGPQWEAELALLATAVAASGRGAIVVAPDGPRAARLLAALPAGTAAALSADLGPGPRYRGFLAGLHGRAAVVVGTRASVFAPLPRLGMVLVLDDGSDSHRDPHAPYPHVREVALLRAHQQGCAVVLAGHARSVEAQQLVTSGWAGEVVAARETVRAVAPRVQVAGSDAELARDPAARTARLPSLAWRTAREALASGPVLVQVPRAGYQPGLSCVRCRAPARCPRCHGPLQRAAAGAVVSCRWCARPAADWRCPDCGGTELRATAVGAERTGEELGRAFPGVPVSVRAAGSGARPVSERPRLVIATPGSEPPVEGAGYAAVLLLDGWALLNRPDLRAAEEALRRWLNALARARPGAPVVVCADPGAPAVQALVRWDPAGLAAREVAERGALRFPPAARMAALRATGPVLTEITAGLSLPPGAELLGPVPEPGAGPEEPERLLVRVPRRYGPELAAALHALQAVRSARKAGPGLRVELDPELVG